jgi:hypothetical protein
VPLLQIAAENVNIQPIGKKTSSIKEMKVTTVLENQVIGLNALEGEIPMNVLQSGCRNHVGRNSSSSKIPSN